MKFNTPAALVAGDIENAMLAATPGGIEAQEAMGQAAFVGTKESLPVRCPRQQLESLGFVFGDQIDDLFIAVTFPKGWSKKATDHSMRSDLLDDQGRKRGGIFYKAAFYDRKADMHSLSTRYSVRTDYPQILGQPRVNSAASLEVSAIDHDGTVLHTEGTFSTNDYKGYDAAQLRCGAWLTEHFPDWQNPIACW